MYKNQYILTDGNDVYEKSFMTEMEVHEANKKAFKYTNGNLYWAIEHKQKYKGGNLK